jgi:hypothetical protein
MFLDKGKMAALEDGGVLESIPAERPVHFSLC